MQVLNVNSWRDCVYKQLDTHKTIYASAVGLAAYIFKSKRPAGNSVAMWNDNLFQAKTTFAKLSVDKQTELLRNVVLKIPFEFQNTVSLNEFLTLSDTSGGASHILGFLSCAKQAFPVYKDVATHVKIVTNYMSSLFQMALKAHFSDSVFIVNGNCYASGSLLLDLAVEHSVTHWRYVSGSDMHELQISDMSGEGWNINVLEREHNDWCIFVINARRSVLKDFSIHRNCICSNIQTLGEQYLNRRNAQTDQVTHIVTVFDVQHTLDDLKSCLVENETIDILNTLLV